MKKSIYLALFLAGTLALSGCEQKAEVSKPTTLMGFSQLGAESAWRLGNTESMKTAAAAHGIDMMVDNANQKRRSKSPPFVPLSHTAWMLSHFPQLWKAVGTRC